MSTMLGNVHGVLRLATDRGGGSMWWHGLVGSLVLLALTVLLASRPAIAQRLEKVARVGVLISTSPDCAASPTCRALVQRLRELGYVEGQNLRLEYRTAEGQMERLPALAAELVRLPVDVLVVSGPEATLRAARDATRTLPIVMIAVDYDPIALGYIAGLPRPGGNITGVVLQQLEVTGKCLALLKDALSQLARVAVLWDAHSADQLRVAEAAARELGVQVHALALSNPPADDFEGAFAAAVREGADALLVLRSPRFFAARAHIVALAAQHRLPAMYSSRWAVEVGGLMAYGASQGDLAPRAAEYVDKLLKGAIPATLPVEQPMKFEFVINLKTAQALGLTLPPHILVFANEVIR